MYRKLTDHEIGILTMQGCSADDWNLILIVNHFLPDNIENVKFSGNIKIGLLQNQ